MKNPLFACPVERRENRRNLFLISELRSVPSVIDFNSARRVFRLQEEAPKGLPGWRDRKKFRFFVCKCLILRSETETTFGFGCAEAGRKRAFATNSHAQPNRHEAAYQLAFPALIEIAAAGHFAASCDTY